MKVRSQLEATNPAAFREFVTTLGYFQATSSSTLDLYRKMESILAKQPDLMEEFVLFLSPEEALQCGVQFQHFLYVRMREFFSKLKVSRLLNLQGPKSHGSPLSIADPLQGQSVSTETGAENPTANRKQSISQHRRCKNRHPATGQRQCSLGASFPPALPRRRSSTLVNLNSSKSLG